MLNNPGSIGNLERLVILRSFSGFADLPPAEMAAMARYTRTRYFPRGTVLQREGERPKNVYFIADGAIEMRRHGHEFVTMRARDTAGGLAYLARDEDTPSLTCIEDTVALVLPTEDMEDLFEDNFTFLLLVMRALGRGIIEMRRLLGKDAGFEAPQPGPPMASEELDLVERIFFLRKTISFAQSRIEAIAQLARNSKVVRLPAGSVLWKEGDAPHQFLFPASGVIRATTQDGQSFAFGAGSAVGGLDWFANQPRWFTAAVEQDLVAIEISAEEFIDLLEDSYDLARDFLAVMAQGLTFMYELVAGHKPGSSFHGDRPLKHISHDGLEIDLEQLK